MNRAHIAYLRVYAAYAGDRAAPDVCMWAKAELERIESAAARESRNMEVDEPFERATCPASAADPIQQELFP